MRYSSQVNPISYLKANAAEVLAHLAENRVSLVITQNGEAKAVLQDVSSFEETQKTLTLLKILALGLQEVVEVVEGLAQCPECGSHPGELVAPGRVHGVRQAHNAIPIQNTGESHLDDTS